MTPERVAIMQRFISGEVCVRVANHDELFDLMHICDGQGFLWDSGEAPMVFAPNCKWRRDRITVAAPFKKRGMLYSPEGNRINDLPIVNFDELDLGQEAAAPLDLSGLF